MNKKTLIQIALEKGQGIFRLSPNWVPRSFCIPGRRLKLNPDDYYPHGGARGGIDERWLASTINADNGPGTPPDEGMSYIHINDGAAQEKVLLRDAIDLAGRDILGEAVMRKYGGWTMYSKFFDNLEPLPFHLHLNDEYAARVGRSGKPEAYYFPRQLNNHPGLFPYTFFGFNPETTRDDIRKCIKNYDCGDNGILDFSRAYRLTPGTGWDVPPGVLHAPGSLLTYEPQKASDVYGMYQSLTWNKHVPRELLVKDVPAEHHENIDYLLDLIDWDTNCDPDFHKNRFRQPVPVKPVEEMSEDGYGEYHIVYGSEYFSARELTVFPGRSVKIRDDGGYGLIVLQGHGTFGVFDIEAPTMIRFGQMTSDELFVSEKAAREGVTIVNRSATDDLVMLKHFGPRA